MSAPGGPAGAPAPVSAGTVGEALSASRDALRAVGVGEPALDAQVLLAEATGLSTAALIADPGRDVCRLGIQDALQRRLVGVGVAGPLEAGGEEQVRLRFEAGQIRFDPVLLDAQ